MIDHIVSIKSDRNLTYPMSDKLEFKYEVEIKSVDKRQTLSKEIKDELINAEKTKILNMHSISHYDKVRRSVSIKFYQ